MAATFGNISPEAASGFLRMFRAARERAVADSEDFQELIFSVERFGGYLHGKSGKGLADYTEGLVRFVADAGVAPKVGTADLTPRELLDLVRRARNDYMHQGARARHLVHHAVALALLLEDALMNRIDKVKHFMTAEVATIEGWEPLSRVRQLMLQNGYSYIPYRKAGPQQTNGSWTLISERSMARAIRSGKTKDLLSMEVRRAVEGGWLELERAEAVTPEDDVADFVRSAREAGLTLVMDGERLVGVITPFDLI